MRTANFKSAAIAALLSMGLLTGCTNGITNQKTSNQSYTGMGQKVPTEQQG